MTIETLERLVYYMNATKMTRREREAINGVILEAIIHGEDIDIQSALRKYGAVDEEIKKFLEQVPTGEYGAEQLYQMYCGTVDSPVTITRFGKEVKSLGVAFAHRNTGMHYTIGGNKS